MNTATILLILAAGLANGQLNFEGNPLTEDTEYTAMESQLSERTVGQEKAATNALNTLPESSQNFHSSLSNPKNTSEYSNPSRTMVDNSFANEDPSSRTASQRQITQTPRHLPSSAYNQGIVSMNHAEVALNTFLNSKTPEESRASLDHYLQSREPPDTIQATTINQQQLTQQPVPQVNQQPDSSLVNQHLTAQLVQQRQAFPVTKPGYNSPANPTDLRPPATSAVATPLSQQQMLQPYTTGMQSRNDALYPGWYHRMRRVRGKPFSYAQSRVGPGFYGAPIPPVSAIPFKPKGPPVEVIYTKPPGFHRGPPPISNPPVGYEDASAWFPDSDQPPPSKDVYYSQLYAQSYDPYYYNYIAKTGKIKPHLYGKLGKYHEEGGDGIWAELYRGFKKHGLKNMMNPTFLLGMTLPVITLMLTALVQKRSMSRSDAREFSQEDNIQEYLEQIQRAVECYERRRRKRDANVDECWS